MLISCDYKKVELKNRKVVDQLLLCRVEKTQDHVLKA